MFYASGDPDTALKEIATKGPGAYAVGCFETRRKCLLLDLASTPEVPSIFDAWCISDSVEYSPRAVLTFLKRVEAEMSRPIAHDDRIHLEYVPTQVVTEFIRVRSLRGRSIEGIRYRSAARDGGISCVVFATKEHIQEGGMEPTRPGQEAWIKLMCTSERELT